MSDIPSTPADGNIKTVLVPAVADLAAPTVAELTGGTVIDISCYLTPGGFALTVNQATITDERECDTIVRQKPGRKTITGTITGIDNTNANDGATPTPAALPNDLAEALTEGSQWVVARRRGVEFTEAFAADEHVSTTSFTVGVRSEVPAEANSVVRSVWNIFIDGHEPDAVVAAGA